MKPLIGAHVSIAGGVSKAPERGAAFGCTALQVFTKSPNQWQSKPLDDAECDAFKENMRKFRIRTVAAHDAYLINLASPDKAVWKRSLDAFIDEMKRCEQLGIRDLVMHPGSHLGSGEKKGIAKVAKALKETLAATSEARVLLETTAGQGNCLGGRFSHLAEIISLLDGSGRLGVCLDTCHIFVAGYDIRTPADFEKTMKEFDQEIGFDRLELFHLNDTKGKLGSRLDRHEHIGEGHIGPGLFHRLVRARRFKHIPKVIETPGGVEGGVDDVTNVERLFTFAATPLSGSKS